MAKLLLVDDDTSLCELVEAYLTGQKYSVECAYTGRHAEDLLKKFEYDLIILDWRLPDVAGTEICKNLRAKGGNIPIIMLTGNDAISQKEEGLDSGVDDYLTKPFDMRELGARVRALLRRPGHVLQTVLTANDISLDPAKHEVSKGGVTIKIFPKEYAILEYMMRNPNKVLTWQSIVSHVWRSDEGVGPDHLKTCIRRLRQLIDDDGQPSMVENVHGVGYMLKVSTQG